MSYEGGLSGSINNSFGPFYTSLYIFCSILVCSAFYITYQSSISPLRNIPGPFLASCTPLWRVMESWSGQWHNKVIELHERYGEVVRIAPNELSITTASAIPDIYGHAGNAWLKSDWYETWWVPGETHGFFAETAPAKHRDLRRRVSKAYSMSYILVMEEYADALVRRFMQQMATMSTEMIDFTKWTSLFTFDVVGELAFGKAFGLLDSGADTIGLAHWVYLIISTRAMLGWTWLQAAAIRCGFVRRLLNAGYLKKVNLSIDQDPRWPLEKIVRTKMELHTSEGRHDLLTHFIRMKNPDGSPLGRRDIFGECMNVVAAGADTTAISLRAITYYIASNPRVYRKLQQEIDSAATEGRLSTIVKFEEGRALDYLQAVIKEALRLHPAVGFQLPRITPRDGAEIKGYFIPAKTIVGINAWSLHRNKAIFGPNADEFCPERWLSPESEDQLKLMDQCNATFGFGSRTCIGKNLAMMEISKFIPTLFREYDVEICNPVKPWIIVTAWFSYQDSFNVRLHKRSSSKK